MINRLRVIRRNSDGRTEIKDVLYHVGAYDGVEFIVTKRESFNFGFNKSYTRAHDSPHFPSARLLCRFGPIPYAIGGFLG